MPLQSQQHGGRRPAVVVPAPHGEREKGTRVVENGRVTCGPVGIFKRIQKSKICSNLVHYKSHLPGIEIFE
jgi:hypothetical protein